MTDETVKYVITRLDLSSGAEIQIPEQEFNEIAGARAGLLRALRIEERFNMIVGNFEEFELEILRIANCNMIYLELNWDGMQSARYLLGRRLLNLLSTVRAYLDQTSRDLKRAYGEDSLEHCGYMKAKRDAFGRSLSYRVMEHLRNHAQHCDEVVHRLGYPMTRDPQSGVVTHSIDLGLDIDVLTRDGGFNMKVIDELRKRYGDIVNLRDLVRDYVEELGAIHEEWRHLGGHEVEAWKALEEECTARYVRNFGGETAGLVAAAIRLRNGHEDDVLEELHLNGNIARRRGALAAKNRKILNCRSQRVASGPD